VKPIISPQIFASLRILEAMCSDELDPVLKAKLYPMALLKAKKNPQWDSLTSEEKSALTDDGLRKLGHSKK
jgi:hypothetical protein